MQSQGEIEGDGPSRRAERCLTVLGLVGVPVLVLLGLTAFAFWSPRSRFLVPVGQAEWILYPVPPRSNANPGSVEQHTVFKRTFDLTDRPGKATLRFRAFQSCSVEVNGHSIDLPQIDRWNQVDSCDIASRLRVGRNDKGSPGAQLMNTTDA